MIRRFPWKLWLTQVIAIVRIEARKDVSTKRAIPVCLLALVPMVIFGAHTVAYGNGWVRCDGQADMMMYAGVFQVVCLRLAIFFGCVIVFTNLFRGDVLEKSLHYYFLAPVRRDVLVVGKFLSGLATVVLIYGLSTGFSYLITAAHRAAAAGQDFLAGSTVVDLFGYIGVTALACLGYGAVFLAMGLLFRNPIVPAVTVLVWESINIFLPPMLKQISIIFYLESLCPVMPARAGSIFAIHADPVPAGLAIPGLAALSVAVLAFAAWKIRTMEIRYGVE
jgi:ABC-type transport system involved in multi-copper enzyme maturation permease subunit